MATAEVAGAKEMSEAEAGTEGVETGVVIIAVAETAVGVRDRSDKSKQRVILQF